MKITEAKNIFDNILSEFEGSGSTNEEFCEYFNTATILRMQDDFDDNMQGRRGYENDMFSAENWRHLVVNFRSDQEPFLETDAKGRLSVFNIQQHFPDQVSRSADGLDSVTKPDIWRVIFFKRYNPITGQFRRVDWLRHNENPIAQDNPFRQATDRYPTYTIQSDHYQLLPEDSRLLEASIVHAPIRVYIDDKDVTKNIDPVVGDSIVLDIVFRALCLTGLSLRDAQFYQLIQNEKR